MSDFGKLSLAGTVSVTRIEGPALLTLRGDAAVLGAALAALGLPAPEQRQLRWQDGQGVGWMSPDDRLLLIPRGQLAQVRATLQGVLAGRHHLLVEITEGRAMLHLQGSRLREVLAKACPVDLAPSRFEPGELRRTRAAQIPVAFWLDSGTEARLICMRSVADYAVQLFTTLARPGAEVGIFD